MIPLAKTIGANRPFITGLFYIPTRVLEARVSLSGLKRELTVKHYDAETGTTTPVYLYDDDKYAGYIGLPRHFGQSTFPDLWAEADDRRVRPNFNVNIYRTSVTPRDEQQEKFVSDLIDAFGNVTIADVQANAATGSGKTISSLLAAVRQGLVRIAVIVHTNRIKHGWLGSVEEKKGLRFLFGDEWVKQNVGICQQDVCDYKDKAIVICLAPSLVSRPYPEDFYEYFGAVYVDEVHKMAAPTFHHVMGAFPAFIHLGLTATEKTGAMGKCIYAHIGKPAIVSDQEVMQPKVYRVVFEPEEPMAIIDYGTGQISDTRRSIITPLSRHRTRQNLLALITYWRGYVRGKNCLVISDRTDQLIDLKKRLVHLGVPEEEIGMYVGAYRSGEFKLTGTIQFSDKAGNVTKKHFRGLPPFATRQDALKHKNKVIKDAKLTVIHDGHKIGPWTIKPKEEEYEDIEKRSRIVLATYGIFDVAIDIKRLDWGLEATPRGDVAQAVGRILRELIGKGVPEWYSIFDKIFYIATAEILGQTMQQKRYYSTPIRLEKQRRVSYRKQNAIEIRIDNAAQAIEKAKAASVDGQGIAHSGQGSSPQTRPGRPRRRLRLVRRTLPDPQREANA